MNWDNKIAMFEGYENLPLPPPWRRVYFETKKTDKGEIHYMNDITKDVTSIHPLVKLLSDLKEREQEKEDEKTRQKEEDKEAIEGVEFSSSSEEECLQVQVNSSEEKRKNSETEISERRNSERRTSERRISQTEIFGRRFSEIGTGIGTTSRPETANTDVTGTTSLGKSSMDRGTGLGLGTGTGTFLGNGFGTFSGTFLEYKCTWKEPNLFLDKNIFSLSIRYNIRDAETMIKFDGNEYDWERIILESTYGPIIPHDLFIGSKIKIYGRIIIITTASRESCQWVETEYKKLLKQQEKMRLKIEKIGIVPAVTRPYIAPVTHFSRDGPGFGGRCDLRKIHNENSKLGEQLALIGMGPKLF